MWIVPLVSLLLTAKAHAISKTKEEHHNFGIVSQWLQSVSHDVKFDEYELNVDEVAHAILTGRGWGCYVTLVQLQLHMTERRRSRRGSSPSLLHGIRPAEKALIERMCFDTDADGVSTPSIQLSAEGVTQTPGDTLLVFNRQHNGLGNQIFQYVFSRLMAESLQRQWSTSLLDPVLKESPWNKVEYPPNSEGGWALFKAIFEADESRPAPGHRSSTTTNSTQCLDAAQRCKISDRPWDQHVSKESLLSQLIGALYSPECARKCIFTIGYFQEPLFFEPFRRTILTWLPVTTSAVPLATHGYPSVGDNDIVVHVRCCDHKGGGCDWLYLPFEYYDAVLSRLTARRGPEARVFLVAPCASNCAMVEAFKRKYGAKHVTPPAFRKHLVESVGDDFRFLMQARALVLGKSTFGFWAAYLSPQAAEVHMPVENGHNKFEKIPMLPTDGRFVYHNPGTDEWFGQVQGGEMRFEERGRWFGPKVFDRDGKFIVEKKSKPTKADEG